MDVSGKVVVVTGGGSGIGRALSQELATRGATVAVCDVSEAAAKDTVALLPGGDTRHGSFLVDVADMDSASDLAAQVLARFDRVDILINNAGVLGRLEPLEEIPYSEFKRIVDIDMWGAIHCTRAFLAELKSRPSAALVNVSSAAGLVGLLGNSAYFTAKFGVRGFTESIQSELRRTNVRVSVVYPGVVKTNLGGSHPDYSEEQRTEAIRRYNEGQPGITPERAARTIVRGIERERMRILVGPDVWVIDKLVRLLPTRVDMLAHRVLARIANAQRIDGRKVFS